MVELKYTKELLEKLATESFSISEVCRKLGAKRVGGSSHRWVRKKLKDYDIDISHFKGQHWSKGLTLKEINHPRALTDEDIFVKGSRITGTKLRKFYIQKNPDYKCAICLLKDWMGQKITLHIDHINGICNDNREENLRWLCPNCHQQTNTWGNTKSAGG